MGPFEVACLSLAAILGGLVWRDHRALVRSMERPAPPPPLVRYPSVSVIRPIKGLDPELERNVQAALDHGYPGRVETIFVFDDECEPGVPAVEKAIAAHREAGRPGTAEILFCGPPPAGRTGKLNAMLAGVQRAGAELIAFADSDIRSDRAALRILVETLLGSPGAGSAFAPVVVSEPARSLGDAACAMLLNGLYTPAAGRALRRGRGDLPFILGQFMLFTREALSRIGGLERAGGQLVDDLYIGALVARAGLRNVASCHPIRIIQYGLSPAQALAQYSRWITFSRTGILQWSFKLPIVARATVFWLGLLGAVAAAAAGSALLAAAGAALAIGVVASVDALHNRTGCTPLRPRHWIAPAVLFLLAPAVFARIVFVQRRVDWRGRTYDLDPRSRLAAPGR